MMRLFAKDAALYSLPTLLGRLVGLILLPIYARHLGPADMGFVEIVAAVSVFALLLIPCEINQAMARFLPETDEHEQQKQIVYSVLAFTFWAFVIVSAAGYGARYWIFDNSGIPPSYVIYTWQILLYLITLACVQVLQVQFRFLQQAVAAVAMNLAIIVLNLAMMILLSLDRLTLSDYFFSQIVSNGVGVLLALGFLWKRMGVPYLFPEVDVTRRLLAYSMPIMVSSFGVAVATGLDRILIGRFSGLAELGQYAVASRFAAIAAMTFMVANFAMTPLIYRNHEDPQTRIFTARLFHAAVAGCILILVALSFLGDALIALLAGPQFAEAGDYLFFLVLAVILSNAYIFFKGMDISKNTRLIGKINLAMGAVAALVSLILIPLFGVWGAIISATFAALLRLGLYIHFSQRTFPLNINLILPAIFVILLIIFNYARTA